MIEVALVAGIATFAVTAAIVDSEMFTQVRRVGVWARNRGKLLYYLLTPLRATHCSLCTSFWASMPVSWCVSPWGDLFTVWLAAAGISIFIYSKWDTQDDLSLFMQDAAQVDDADTAQATTVVYNRKAGATP